MAELRVDLGYAPRPHQREAHERRARFTVLVWHRRAGKTVWALLELILAALRDTRQLPRYGYVAPLLTQARTAAWDYLRLYTRAIPGVSYNASEGSVRLPNGALIRVHGADDPDSLRSSYWDGVVLDEVAQMRPETWGEVIRPALADRAGWAVFIGTPKGQNLFSEKWHESQSGEPGWYGEMRRWQDTGALSVEEIEAARREMGEAEFAQEFECDFSAAVVNVLISVADVTAAQQRDPPEADYAYAARVLGVDVARLGGDEVVLFRRQGRVAFRPRGFRPADLAGAAVLMEVAGQVAREIDAWQPDAVFVDQGGLGAGVVDRLTQLGYAVRGVDFGGAAVNGVDEPAFANKRCEMWWRLGGWLKDGGALPKHERLLAELTAPTYSYANAAGRFELESKASLAKRGALKGSPDYADALALTFAAPVAARLAAQVLSGRGRVGRIEPGRLEHEWDPYAAEGA